MDQDSYGNPAQSPEPAHTDPTHSASDPTSYWNTTNLAEIVPGVASPLCWTLWGPAADEAARASLASIGAFGPKEAAAPSREEDRAISIFFGRVAAKIDFFCQVGDCMPGTTGEAVARQVFSFVPPDYVAQPSRRRYAIIAVRFPMTFLGTPRQLARARAETQAWWEREVGGAAALDLAGARALFAEAKTRFDANVRLQGIAVLALIQPVFDQLSRLAAAAGVEPAGIMAGYGSHEETQIVNDLWACSRGRLDIETVARRHGYHGPREGEISSYVWREDPAPLLRALEGYLAMPDTADPVAAEARKGEERRQAEDALLAALSPARRAGGRLVLKLAHKYLPLRGVQKVAFSQAFDVARAAARRIGQCLEADGVLAAADDVFFLTADELTTALPADVLGVVAARRERTAYYETLELPSSWQGPPVPTVAVDQAPSGERVTVLEGVGASAGVVEGTVRVVTDPATAEVEIGDVLVAHTTDPSWASVMFLASALVVDIGGLLSHAAVVARELGVPCVMATGNGTRVLRSGDVCRVDGTTGRVEILKPAEE